MSSTLQLKPLGETLDAHKRWMRVALEVAGRGLKLSEVPIGCVICYVENFTDEEPFNETDVANAVAIGEGHNETVRERNATRHAELVAVDHVMEWCISNGKQLEATLRKCMLYVTCEPCIMCASAVVHELGIPVIVYGCKNDRFGGMGTVFDAVHLGDSAAASGLLHNKCEAIHAKSEVITGSTSESTLGEVQPIVSITTKTTTAPSITIISGVLVDEAMQLLREFYKQENVNAPIEKRKLKAKRRRTDTDEREQPATTATTK